MGWQDAELLPVFGDRAAGDGDALRGERDPLLFGDCRTCQFIWAGCAQAEQRAAQLDWRAFAAANLALYRRVLSGAA